MLLLGRSFGFRDAANYYYPLFEWQCNEWSEGRVPLWNPLDNLGTPVLADTTSSVLYPGKLVFVLPISFRLRYHLYVTAHVLLAAGLAYWLARHWNSSREAAGLAALSYAFGGSVLFQYCNVVFLVGAAWLPLGLLAADRMLRESSFRWAVWLGAVLALMVLGGDPQAAYHTGMLAALYALLLKFDVKPGSEKTAVCFRQWHLTSLSVAAMSGICLSLVQVLPAVEWARQSSRHSPDNPRNLYEAADSFVSDGEVDLLAMTATPQAGTHLRHVYDFSNGPWHLVEFVWPNFFGRIFPINSRWSTAFPGEGRTWTPSLYMGFLPFILALLSWRLRRCDSQLRFVSLLTLLAIIASFGWYGIGWVIHELRAALMSQNPADTTIGEPVGGLYWLFVTLLPGYVYFRYPAKLLAIASLGISLLAARGWDGLVRSKPRQLANASMVVAGMSLLLAAAFGACQHPWTSFLATAPADSIFGPLDIQIATSAVLVALLHATILGLAMWFLFRTTHMHVERWRGDLLLIVTAIDICIANGWMPFSIPGSIWSEPQQISKVIQAENDSHTPPRLVRDSTTALLPESWREESAMSRLAEVVSWERTTLLPKHHLNANVGVIGSHTTLTSADWQAFLRVASANDSGNRPDESYDSLLDVMSVQYGLELGDLGEREEIVITGNRTPLVRNSHSLPRAWSVHKIETSDPDFDRSQQQLDRQTRKCFLDNGKRRDLRSLAILETNEDIDLASLRTLSGDHTAAECCEISDYSPQFIKIDVALKEPGCVILNDSYYPGWQATRITNDEETDLTIYRANRLMRAVILPAGKHVLIYRYRPRRFLLGAAVSIVAWALAIGLWLRHSLQMRTEGQS